MCASYSIQNTSVYSPNFKLNLTKHKNTKNLKLQLKSSTLKLRQDQVITIHCDNQSGIYEWTKNINIKLHFVRDIIAKGSVKVRFQLITIPLI